MSEWIPFSERLPEAFQTVLRSKRTAGWNETINEYVDIGAVCPADHDVVAWMPLPEPYKEDAE